MSKPKNTPAAPKGKAAPPQERRKIEPATIEVNTGTLLALIWMAAPELLHARYEHAPADPSGVLPSPGQNAHLLLKHFRQRAERETKYVLERIQKGPKEEARIAFTSNHPAIEAIWMANFESSEGTK